MLKKLFLFLLLVIVLGGVGAYEMATRVDRPFRGYAGDFQEVEIAPGSGTRAIGDRLVEAGVVSDTITYRLALWSSGSARRLKAGEYRFDRAMTPREVLGKIARGEVDVVNITFREGLTIPEMAAVFESSGLGTAVAFRAAASDASLVANLDPRATDLEGYLFPETYGVSRHVQAPQLVRLMVDRFTRVLSADMRAAAEARGLSVRQLVTLASIVEKETASVEERPIVASVYSNRLRIGMALQCDPTVIYALQRIHRYDGNLRRGDLAFDSPYNTYRYAGLPPGPIAAPGKGSLEAASHPAADDYLYFVSRNDGTHAFARTLDEHNRNVQKFQVQFFHDKHVAERRRDAAATHTHEITH